MILQKYFTAQSMLLSILILLMGSCQNSDETCRKQKEVLLQVGIYTKNNQKLTIQKLSLQGIGVENKLYSEIKTDKLVVPLNKLSTESAFKITFDQANIDTLTIRYDNKFEFLSLPCGSIYTHSIDTAYATHHFIDSISIKQKNVNTHHAEHLQIYHFQ